MRKWAKGTARATLLTASFVALGAGPALADVTSGDGSVLGGNQITAPVSAPVDVSGNAIAVVGRSLAGSTGGASVRNNGDGGGAGQRTSGRHSVLGGNQVNAPVSVPVNACGNAVAIVGQALAGCEGGAKVTDGGHDGYGGYGGQRTSGRHSVLGGNQVNAPVSAPINVCGNAAAALGDAVAGCEGGAKVINGGHHGLGDDGGYGGPTDDYGNPSDGGGYGDGGYGDGRGYGGYDYGGGDHDYGGGDHGYGGGQHTSGRHSVGGGNQVNAPISAPVNICGNAVGNAFAGCEGGATVNNGGQGGYGGYGGYRGYGGWQTSGRHSVLGGNQVNAPVQAPVNVCGNAVAVLGDAVAGCDGLIPHTTGHHVHGRTSGEHSVGGGNQITAPVTAPVNVCGNAAAVVGQAYGSCGADDDCICPSSAPASRRPGDLPQLPIEPARSRGGAMPVSLGAVPALPQLPVDPARPANGPMPVSRGAVPALSQLPAKVSRATPGEVGAPRLPGQAPAAPMSAAAAAAGDALPLVPGCARVGDVGGLMPGTLSKPILPGGRQMTPQSAYAPSLPGLPEIPVGRPVSPVGTGHMVNTVLAGYQAPPADGAPRELPPLANTAADSPTTVQAGGLAALALGGMLALSSVLVSAMRRPRRH